MPVLSSRAFHGLVCAIVTGLSMSVSACGSDDDDDNDHMSDESEGTSSGASCPSTDAPTYGSFGRDFMENYCTRCHSSDVKGAARMMAPGDHNFDSLDEIALMVEHIDQAAAAGPDAVNTRMPPSDPKPSMLEREKLGQWLACMLGN